MVIKIPRLSKKQKQMKEINSTRFHLTMIKSRNICEKLKNDKQFLKKNFPTSNSLSEAIDKLLYFHCLDKITPEQKLLQIEHKIEILTKELKEFVSNTNICLDKLNQEKELLLEKNKERFGILKKPSIK